MELNVNFFKNFCVSEKFVLISLCRFKKRFIAWFFSLVKVFCNTLSEVSFINQI